MQDLIWSDFKSLLDDEMPFMHVELSGSYEVYCSVRQVTFHCQLPKNGGAEVIEYEVSYKSLAIVDDVNKVAETVREDKFTLTTRSFAITVPAGETATVDREISPNAPATKIAVKSGLFFSDTSAVGDVISASVIDKDNVLGYGATPEAPITLAVYVPEWQVMPGVVNELENYSIKEMPIPGLFIRMSYTNNSASSVKAVCNLVCYEFI